MFETHLDGSGSASKYSQEDSPLEYQGVLYVVTGNDDVFAIDAVTGQHLWTYLSHTNQKNATVCCGWDARGVALGGGLVYVAQLDGSLVALNQMNGQVVWKVENVSWQDGQTMTMSPEYYNGMVYVGMSGGEFGGRGSETAYNATNGDIVWRYYTVPAPGDVGFSTWPEQQRVAARRGDDLEQPVDRPGLQPPDLHDRQRRSVERSWPGQGPVQQLVRRRSTRRPASTVALPGRPPRHLGLRLPVADGAVRRPDRPSAAARRGRVVQDGLDLRDQPGQRRSP